MKLFLTSFIILCALSSNAQLNLQELDFQKIPQEEVRLFIRHQIDLNKTRFKDLHASYYPGVDLEIFNKHEKSYLIKATPEEVWEAYTTTSPAICWNGKRFSFGVLVSKNKGTVMYKSDPYNGIQAGQVFFMNVGVMHNLETMAVGLEIVTVDPENKIIEFSYVNGGNTRGLQQVELYKTKKGFTRVYHRTLFASESKFRDRYLYPFFHERIIDEFHRNMRKRIFVAMHE